MRSRSTAFLPAVFAALIAAFVIGLSSGAPQPRAAARGLKIPQSVRDRAARSGRVRVIVELTLPNPLVAERHLPNGQAIGRQRQMIATRAAQTLARVPNRARRTLHQFQTIPYVALEVTPEGLDALAALDSDVVRVFEDKLSRPALAESVPLIQGDQVWAAGYDGTGTVIAILDTGVDSAHPFFTGKITGEACFSTTSAGMSQSICPSGQNVEIGVGAAVPCTFDEGCIHGTHVAGIAAGRDPNGIEPSGVAKGAQVMPVQVFAMVTDAQSCGGTAPCLGGFDSDIIAGLEYVYNAALGGANIVAANMSLGEGDFDTQCDDSPFKPAIDNLRAIGVATVAAAGNSGSPFSLLAPACVSSAVSVGATTKSDEVAWFSQVAPFLSVFAPGESIRSSVPGGGYEVLDGTSMASPHVAGAWGLLRQAVPDATVDAVLSALRSTGLPITDTRYEAYFGPGSTIPRIRVMNALDVLIPTDSPVPTISSLSPPRTFVGAGTLTLRVLGGGFTVRSVVEWNGIPRPTTLIDSGTLQASIPSSDFTAIGTAQVRVTTAPPGGGTSSEITFTIGPPPVITVDRTLVAPGDPVTMTLTGSDGGDLDELSLAPVGSDDEIFYASTEVGAGVTDTTWTVRMPSEAASVEFRLFVNGSRVSASPTITVDPSVNPIPVATSLTPPAVIFGGPSFTLTVNGSKFLPTSVVRWNGADKPTTFVSANALQAPVDASEIAAVGTALVTVFTPSPAGGTSDALTLRINPPPALAVNTTGIAPGGSVTVTLTNGWGGEWDWIALASTTAPDTTYIRYSFVGAGVMTFPWTVTMPTAPGNYEFRYYRDNTYVREATSPTVGVLAPTPTLSSISPTSAPTGGSAFTLTVNGTNFGTNSAVRWNGSSRPTTFVSSTQLTAAIPASDLSAVGTAQVTAFTPAPGGGSSGAATFTVLQTPVLTVNTISVTIGSPVTVTLTNGLGGSTDYIALAATSAPNNSYITYVWVGAGATTRTWTVNMPNTPGAYEFRFFPNNGIVRLATSPTVTVTPPPSPVPVLSSLSQPRTVVGLPFTMTLNGSNFVPSSVGRLNGADRATTYVSATQLQMAITAADVAATGTAQLTVFNPAPGGGLTAALPLDIVPAPVLSVDRTSATTGTVVTMTMSGGLGGSSDWIALAPTTAPNTSSVTWIWAGTGATRTWTATMPATPGNYEFRLFLNNGYFRAATSPAVAVTQAANPSPVLTSMNQTRAVINVPFNLTLTGSGFVSTSTALWNGNPRPTTYVSSTQLKVAVPAGDLTALGTAQVSVSTPAPGGGVSSALSIDVIPPPVLTVDSTSAVPGTTVTVTMTGGVGGNLDWLSFAATSAGNGSYLSYVFVGGGVTSRTWSATMPSTPGTYEFRLLLNNENIRVATSPAINVAAGANPVPVLNSLSQPRVMVGLPITIALNGSGFVSSSVAQWNGTNRPTTFVSATQLTMSIPASDLTAIGTAHIGVSTPAPGGGSSALLSIDIVPAPTLSVNTTSAVTGQSVTVTLSGGLGGSQDWFALAAASAPNNSNVTWTWVGGGVTSRTWSANMPATPGTYEFRLFLNNDYIRAATSPAITVTQAPNPAPGLTSVFPSKLVVGMPTTISLNGSGYLSSSVVRWNGADRPTTFISANQLKATIPAGDVASATTALVSVSTPAPGGGLSPAVPVDVVPAPVLSVSTTSAAHGTQVTVTMTGGLGGTTDWFSFAGTSMSETSYVSWTYVGAGLTTATWTVTLPQTAGTYEFRLYRDNGSVRIATSPTITVF